MKRPTRLDSNQRLSRGQARCLEDCALPWERLSNLSTRGRMVDTSRVELESRRFQRRRAPRPYPVSMVAEDEGFEPSGPQAPRISNP